MKIILKITLTAFICVNCRFINTSSVSKIVKKMFQLKTYQNRFKLRNLDKSLNLNCLIHQTIIWKNSFYLHFLQHLQALLCWHKTKVTPVVGLMGPTLTDNRQTSWTSMAIFKETSTGSSLMVLTVTMTPMIAVTPMTAVAPMTAMAPIPMSSSASTTAMNVQTALTSLLSFHQHYLLSPS